MMEGLRDKKVTEKIIQRMYSRDKPIGAKNLATLLEAAQKVWQEHCYSQFTIVFKDKYSTPGPIISIHDEPENVTPEKRNNRQG